MKKNSFPSLLCAVLCTFFLCACGPGNEIQLLSLQQPTETTLPKPNAATVTVVEFTDARDVRTSIGQRRDQTAFTTSRSATQWISHALADELSRHGLMVSYAKTFDQARKANPDFLVTGKLLRLWLNEASSTYLEAILEAQFTVANREKHLLRENNKAQASRNWPTTKAQVEVMLRDTMHDLIEPIAKKFANTIKKQKK